MMSSLLTFALSSSDASPCSVRIAVPAGLMPPGGWPVAYVLDLKQFEGMRADPVGLPGLLVGLGPQVPENRVVEYVPAGWRRAQRRPSQHVFASAQGVSLAQAVAATGASDPGFPAHDDAGAARWLRTLDQVRARVAGEFRLDPGRQVLCGHSLGALFGVYVLLHRPRAFDGYVLSSPSVWWGARYLHRLLHRRLAWLWTQGLPGLGVWLRVGADEQGLSPQEQALSPAQGGLDEAARTQRLALRQARGMVDGLLGLSAALSSCPGLRLHGAVLPGRTHQTAPQDALMPGWHWLLGVPT